MHHLLLAQYVQMCGYSLSPKGPCAENLVQCVAEVVEPLISKDGFIFMNQCCLTGVGMISCDQSVLVKVGCYKVRLLCVMPLLCHLFSFLLICHVVVQPEKSLPSIVLYFCFSDIRIVRQIDDLFCSLKHVLVKRVTERKER